MVVPWLRQTTTMATGGSISLPPSNEDLLRRHGRAQHRSLARLLGCDGRRTWLISGCELRDNVHDCDRFSLQYGGDNRQSWQYVSSCKMII